MTAQIQRTQGSLEYDVRMMLTKAQLIAIINATQNPCNSGAIEVHAKLKEAYMTIKRLEESQFHQNPV
jgi:hypothetical protein